MGQGELGSSRAVVVGAGIGGLTAAAAVARHISRVTILERDSLPSEPMHRLGAPQGRHVHGLLCGGLNALNRLFPGFDIALAAEGAIPVRIGLDARLEQPGYDPFPQRDLGLTGYSMSRPLLEQVVRRFVERNDRIEIRAGCHVREITGTSQGVSGVRLHAHRGQEESLPADLVIDASGRGALTLDFLRSSGYDLPEESAIGVDIRYTCAVFGLGIDHRRDWQVLQTRPDPSIGRRAIMFPLEGGEHWILGLGGVNGDSAPNDLDGFIEYARTLRTPTAYNAIRNAELQGEIVRFAFPMSFRRHFERMRTFPRGLLPIADAICRINPSFGQGMSVAAKEALLLDAAIGELVDHVDPLAALAPAFFGTLGSVLADPWNAAANDYSYPHLEQARPVDFAERMRFQAALSRLAAIDPAIHKLMTEVSHLIKPSSVYRESGIAERIAAEMRAA